MSALSHNLLAWMLQSIVVGLIAALLPIVFRVRHPRTQLHYCHAALVLCLLLPLLEPRRHETLSLSFPGPWLFAILAAGIVLQLCWMSRGLWRIRHYRIEATPLYPIPEAMQAASAITQADALFCISEQAAGPMMLGWLAPVVLLPPAFLTLNEEAQCGIACHELLHVKRGDWLVTLIEECAGALFWFNPGVWLLLSEARLAREQLVDAESVRLTASREPYIDALLSIARGHAGSDLAPAPSFLRRSHLTQRMQSLLSEAPPSASRVAGSYGSIAVILGCSIWMAAALFPLSAQSTVLKGQALHAAPVLIEQRIVTPAAPGMAVPASVARTRVIASAQTVPSLPVIDPYEPVSGGAQNPSTALERAAALSLLAHARQESLRHAPGTPPYRFTMSFAASGNVLDKGPGELSETWMTGQIWIWTAALADFSHSRLLFHGQLLEDRHVAVIPMRAHMLRNEVFWAIRRISNEAHVRTAKVSLQAKPATCILTSENTDDVLQPGRGWDEEEFCFDDGSGRILVHSVAPGTYAQFEYETQQNFHGWPMPDRIRIYVAGAIAADASFIIRDADAADEASLNPTPGMTSTPRPTELGASFRTRINSPDGASADASQPVIVHAEIDGDGAVVETELSATANQALAPAALELVRKANFGHTGTERQAYVDVRFVPMSQ